MTDDQILLDHVRTILVERSKKAIAFAKQAVSDEFITYPPLKEALNYFMETCNDVSHPTVLSLACEAVGGKPDTTASIGAAFVLLTSAADIHDDIIDNSDTKSGLPTVFGKYGKDVAIIAADVLWIKGMLLLNESIDSLPSRKKKEILTKTKQAFFNLGSAEAKESYLHGKLDITPEEFLELIKLKVSVGVAAAQVGAILGDGGPGQVEKLGRYAETLGVLSTIREEFINMFEPDELENRFKNELLPLPILCAFQNTSLKAKILALLNQDEMTESKLEEMAESICNTPYVKSLGKYMRLSIKEEIKNLEYVMQNREELVKLLEFTAQGLPE